VDLAQIILTFISTIVIFVVVLIIYLAFVLAHPYSEKAKDAIEGPLKGCMVEASVWFAITVAAMWLTTQNVRLATVFEHVVGTNVLSVTIIALSLVVVPITFAVHDAHKDFDYRGSAIGVFLLVAFLCGLYYWLVLPA
jgi:hypothetical protein